MILYVNGDSHSAGAEAVNTHSFAMDDPKYKTLGRSPHPDNLKVSYGALLANKLNATLVCDAESGSSNQRIIRTTNAYLEQNTPDLIIIGWATWEREEWLIGNTYYQFSAYMNTLEFPSEVKEMYKQWVVGREQIHIYCRQWQKDIWDFHQHLTDKNIPHLFFNTYCDLIVNDHLDWNGSYVHPYSPDFTLYQWLCSNNFKPVRKESHHHNADAHQAWANFLFPYLTNLL